MNRFYAPKENFNASTIRLDDSETRHLRDVLRCRVGDRVNVFDGEGSEFESVVEQISEHETLLSHSRKVAPLAPESRLDLTICAAILKGEKTDFAVQKAVELGVNRFVPMLTARCDVKPKNSEKRIARWRKIVLEASKQCGRAKLMDVGDIETFQSAIQTKDNSGKIMFTEREGGKFSANETLKTIVAYFGPEGGWDDSELAAASKQGAKLVTLNGRIMKADTAVIAISAILQHHFGDLN